MFRIFFLFFGFLTLLVGVNADSQMINALYVLDSDMDYQVAYGLSYDQIPSDAVMDVDLYINGELVKEGLCTQFFDNVNGIYGKVNCPIEKTTQGEYVLFAKLTQNSEIIFQERYFFSHFENTYAYYEFEEVDDGTMVIVKVEGEGENLRILSDIPGSVIPSLTVDNQDDLVISDLEYDIVEENPLIAWNIDKIPRDINYTIKKNISLEDRQKFGVEIREASGSNFLTYLVFALFILVLFLAFRPAFKKK